MSKKIFRRIAVVAVAGVITAGTAGMLSACTSDHPEVEITYEFLGKQYEVTYVLSRHDAPQTVKHFLELADAGYYDEQGFVVHDFSDDVLMTGGYTLDENRDLEEVDYFTAVKELEKRVGKAFTQSVWDAAGKAEKPEKGEGLYTVYGEFSPKFEVEGGTEYGHTQGALVMYYSDKGEFSKQVTIQRADKGKNNSGEPLQYMNYSPNSATSLFYTQLSVGMPTGHSSYCVFGMIEDYSVLEEGLLAAIEEYEEGLKDEGNEEDRSFTEDITMKLNRNEPFIDLRNSKIEATFHTPKEPIYLRSVKVTKY